MESKHSLLERHDPVEQPLETFPEEVERLAGDGLAQTGAMDGFFDRQADDIHGRISSTDKASRETIYHEKREYAFRFYGCAAGCPAAAPCFGKRRRKAPPRLRRSPRRTTKSRSEKKSEDGETVYSAAAIRAA